MARSLDEQMSEGATLLVLVLVIVCIGYAVQRVYIFHKNKEEEIYASDQIQGLSGVSPEHDTEGDVSGGYNGR